MRLAALAAFTVCTALSATGQSRSANSIGLYDAGLNMQAGTLSFPAGWQAQGEIIRTSPCSAGSAFPQFRISNPSQGMFLLQMLPYVTLSSEALRGNTDLRTCGSISQLTHAADILDRLVVPQLTRSLPNAQIGRAEAVPGVQPANGNAGGFRTSSDAARVHVSFTEDGQPREEWIEGSTTVTYFPGRMGGGTTSTSVSILSAPQGKLQAVENVANQGVHMTPNTQWQQRNANLDQQQTAAITQQGKQTQGAILAQGQLNMQNTMQKTQQTIDGIHRTGNASMQAAAASEKARHDGAMGTAAYAGDKVLVYYWHNTVTGATTTTSVNRSPGTNWVPN